LWAVEQVTKRPGLVRLGVQLGSVVLTHEHFRHFCCEFLAV